MIILVGMPGSGKSSAGRQVARRFGLPFVDSDHAIEAEIGMPIRQFFAEQGEDAFRDLETAVLQRLLDEGRAAVLATGGGSVLRPANRQLLRRGGTVFYLRTSPDDIHRRLRHDTKRPLLQVPNPRARLHELYRERDPLYRETAHYVIESGRGSILSLVHHLAMQIELAGLVPPAADSHAAQ